MSQHQKTDKNKNEENQFAHRNSLLTDLFENVHIRTVYNMFLAIFVGLFINTAAYDYLKNGEAVLGLKLIKKGFARIHIVLLGWLGLFFGAILIYWCFNVWARMRQLQSKLSAVKFWDLFCSLALGVYYISTFQLSSNLITVCKLPVASAAIIACEQTRLLMKLHSFVRTNAPKVLAHKPHTETELILPSLSSFLYFLFIPTLIYKDTYSRRKTIDWNFVCFRILEIVGTIFFISFIMDRFVNPTVQDFGIRKYTVNEMILCVFENSISGILILMTMFFLILHSWQNLFAELTRYGDRRFYTDWWTSTDVAQYFRKWNIVVQEWLYTYIYKESQENIFPKSAGLAKFSVFFISAIVHEWIVTYSFGFFLPILLVEFLCFGAILSTLAAPKMGLFNVLFWYFLALGMGSLVTTYSFEYYARLNVPIMNPSLKDMLIPRLLTCDCIDFS